MGKPSAIGQPTRPTQPFILLGSINEWWAAIRCPPPHSVEALSGELLRGKGWNGVLCRLKAVWSMPERFKVVCIPCKALYKCSDLLYMTLRCLCVQLCVHNSAVTWPCTLISPCFCYNHWSRIIIDCSVGRQFHICGETLSLFVICCARWLFCFRYYSVTDHTQ